MKIVNTKLPAIKTTTAKDEALTFGHIIALCNKKQCEKILNMKESDCPSELLIPCTKLLATLQGLIKSKEFKGIVGDVLSIPAIDPKGGFHTITVFGTESKCDKVQDDLLGLRSANLEESSCIRLKGVGMSIASCPHVRKAKEIIIVQSLLKCDADGDGLEKGIQCKIISGFLAGIYTFSSYFTVEEMKKKIPLIESVTLLSKWTEQEIQCLNKRIAISESIAMVRDLVNYPANDLYPETYANYVKDLFKAETSGSIKVSIFDEEELKKQGAGLLLGVGQGSDRPPRMVVIEYHGNSKSKEIDLALVGKGITFDSGGLSIKPANYMMDMKSDMAGSAVVAMSILAAAKMQMPINAVAVLALSENTINGHATRPGDVQVSMSGKTVEVLNTDAEGRLVLADAIFYAQKEYKPKYTIDLATLTGAIGVALGSLCAGLFSNNDDLTVKVEEAAKESGELVWSLPMWKSYNKMLNSSIADIKNISGTGTAGSITGAKFIEFFTNTNMPWAHLDIANVSFNDKGSSGGSSLGATGYGVSLIIKLMEKLSFN